MRDGGEAVGVRRRRSRHDWVRWVAKPLVFAIAAMPALWLTWAAAFDLDALGANPIEYVIRFCGDWAMRFLWITLCVSPANALFHAPAVMRFRRMMGLFAFFYAALHLAAYVGIDQAFDFGAVWEDIVKRTYITVGMGAFLALVPLAITSTKGWIRRLGGARWNRLHKLVYPASILVAFHYYMMVKADVREPLVYAAILAILLGYRVVMRTWKRIQRERGTTAPRFG